MSGCTSVTGNNTIKNVLFIAASLVPGGAERVISELSNYFVNNGLAVSILLISGDVVKYDLHPDIKIISMYEDMKGRSGLWAMLRRKFLITQYVKHVNPDIIFSFLSDVNIYSCLALGLSKYKLIVSERNDPERDPASMLKRKIRDVVYKLADGYVFQTEAAKSYFPKSIQQKSTVIPNPIKAELPAPHRGEREKRIVAVGRLEPQKNYVLLLRAFAELHKGYPDYTLDIYGEGSQREYLLRTAKALGVTPRVNFNGVVHNVHDLIKSASLYVLTSDYEGMPNALMEAMAIGLPCVASDCPCGGPAMLIRDGENGLLFPVGDQKALVECMKKILGDKELALLISQNAIHIRNKYKLSSIAEQWMLFAEKNNTVELPGWVGYYEHYINIKKILKKIRYKIWNSPLFKRFLPSKIHVSIEYRALIGKKLNLKNPQSFNEKLQWLKLYDRKPEYIQMVDKYEVRKYISETIGSEYLTPLIGVYDNFDEIDFNSLPNQFVLKPNHTSGNVFICKDKAKNNFVELRKEVNKWLRINYYWVHREWPYKDIRPRIICEQYLVDESGNGLIDYKFMCFNGKVKCIFVCLNRYSETGLNIDVYDINWNLMPFARRYHPNSGLKLNKPKYFNKMVEFAERLSKDIPFLRVDFYEIDGRLCFSELTFYPGSGYEEFTPESYDYLLGSWLNLPKKYIKG